MGSGYGGRTMELTEAIYGRRAIRSYAAEPLSSTLIDDLIDAAIQAPSAMDLEPWAFVVVEGAARLKALSGRVKEHITPHDLPPGIAAQVQAMLAAPDFNVFHNAPTLVVICATSDAPQAIEDCSLAAENFMLTAYAVGLGTCPIGFARPWLRREETKRELGIDPRYVPVFALVVGHPAEHPVSPGRKAPIVIRATSQPEVGAVDVGDAGSVLV